METLKVFGVAAVLLALALSMSGCLTSDDEVMKPASCSVGDTWTYEGDDGTTTVEVVEIGSYGGFPVNVLSLVVHRETDGLVYDKEMLVHNAWFRIQMHAEIEETTTTGNITETVFVTKNADIDRIGPSSLETGQTWTIVMTMHVVKTGYRDGVLVLNTTFDSTETVNYTVVSMEDVTVPAGTFRCAKIRSENEQSHVVNVDFYSSVVRGCVKNVWISGDVTKVNELVSYSV